MVLEDFDSVPLGKDLVRVKTAFAGISYTDIIIQKGWYKFQKEHLPTPYTPGFEASGTVTEVGDEVLQVKVGDKVAILQREGCFSEEIVAKQENVIKIPDDADLKWAASVPVNFFTAWHALYNIVTIFPESRILITSAAGGVGGILTQLCAPLHHTTGLVRNEGKREYVKKLGATVVKTHKDFDFSQRYDVICTSSGLDIQKYEKMLSENGKLIVYGFHSLVPRENLDIFKTIYNYLKLPKLKILRLVYNNTTIAGFNIIKLSTNSKEFNATKDAFEVEIKDKKLTKHSVKTYPFASYQEAFDKLENGETVGKLLLEF